MRCIVRSAAGLVALAAVLLAAPAAAQTGVVYDGDDPGPGYTALESLALFVGIPLLAIIVIVVAVYAPGWMARGGSDDGPREPRWMTSPAGSMSAPAGPGMIAPAGPTAHGARSGASARS